MHTHNNKLNPWQYPSLKLIHFQKMLKFGYKVTKYPFNFWTFKKIMLMENLMPLVYWTFQIVVLENGKVIQQGPHEELLSKPGRYSQLWAQQNDSVDNAAIRLEIWPLLFVLLFILGCELKVDCSLKFENGV